MKQALPWKYLLLALALIVAGGTALLVWNQSAGPPPRTPPSTPSSSLSDSMVELSDHARAMAGIETIAVERRRISREIRVTGKVQFNESTLATITSRVEGYIERLFVDYTGVEVNTGDHLVEIYSPQLLVAQQELLIALEGQRGSALVDSAKRKLLLWGLTPTQVNELISDRKISDRLTLYSPVRGTVIEKMVVENTMTKEGETLYRLANLESVWAYLDVYEYELPWLQPGQTAEARSEALPGEKFTGRIWLVSPVLDEATRTVKVLFNIDNASRKLKPGMYVSAVIRAELLDNGKPAPTGVEGKWTCPMHPLVIQPQAGKCPQCQMTLVQIPGVVESEPAENNQGLLVVPVTAVLDSGVRKLVYVERNPGRFEPVEIETGPRADDVYPVLTGLNEGDKVVARGNFLLDSQFQIRGLPSLFHKEGQSMPAAHQHGGSPPPPTGNSPPQGHEKHSP
jgi:membrane fusion protein, copper/silver efflux system